MRGPDTAACQSVAIIPLSVRCLQVCRALGQSPKNRCSRLLSPQSLAYFAILRESLRVIAVVLIAGQLLGFAACIDENCCIE